MDYKYYLDSYIWSSDPDDLLDNPDNLNGDFQDIEGNTSAMYWSRRYNTAPPNWMIHSPGIRNFEGHTVAMIWIIFQKTEPPRWMWCDPEIQNDNLETCAMLWIRHTDLPVPTWMIHSPLILNNCHRTCAMLWYMCRNTEIERWMCHDPLLRDCDGRTARMMFCIYNEGDDIPEWTEHPADLQDKRGFTCAMFWRRTRKTVLPEQLRHSREIRNKYGWEYVTDRPYTTKTPTERHL